MAVKERVQDSVSQPSQMDVVITLGANDVSSNDNINAINVQVGKAADIATETFLEANIYLSTITPRYGNNRAVKDKNSKST